MNKARLSISLILVFFIFICLILSRVCLASDIRQITYSFFEALRNKNTAAMMELSTLPYCWDKIHVIYDQEALQGEWERIFALSSFDFEIIEIQETDTYTGISELNACQSLASHLDIIFVKIYFEYRNKIREMTVFATMTENKEYKIIGFKD